MAANQLGPFVELSKLARFKDKADATYATKEEVANLDLSDLSNEGDFVQDASYVHTDSNYTAAEKSKVANLADNAGTTYATKTEVQQAVAGLFKYRGSVNVYTDLPSSGMEEGDVYNVQAEYQNNPAGTNYAWTGTAWDALGGSVDLSGYAETGDVPTNLTDLVNDGNFVQDASYVHTDSNYTAAEKAKVGNLASDAESTYATKAEVGALKGSDISNDLDWQTASEVQQTVNAAVAGLYDYKGSVNAYSDLPSSNVEAGDVYNVQSEYQNTPAGTNYAWNGTSWDPLGGEIDLSGYAELTDLPTGLTDLTNDGDFVQDASYVHTDNNYTSAEKSKLAGVEAQANNYTLPKATDSTLGGVTVGDGIQVDGGRISLGDVSNAESGGPLKSLTAEGYSFQKTTSGKNLLDRSTEQGGFIASNGDEDYSVGWLRSDYIPVTAGVAYTFTPNSTEGDAAKGAFFDSSKAFITGSSFKSGPTTVTTPMNAAYVRVSYRDSSTDVQLELGSTATSYEPYTGGAPSPSPDYPQDIKVARGRNLLPLLGYTNRSNNGINYVHTNDGIRISGTSTAASFNITGIAQAVTAVLSAGTYVLSFDAPSGSGISVSVKGKKASDSSSVNILDYGASGRSFTIAEKHEVYIIVLVASGKTVDTTLHPQLELGSTPTPYVPCGHVGLEVRKDYYQQSSLTQNGSSRVMMRGTERVNKGDVLHISIDNASMQIGFGIVDENDTLLEDQGWKSNGAIVTARYDGYLKSNIRKSDNSDITIADVMAVNFKYETISVAPIPLPLKSDGERWAGGLPDGTGDALSVDSAGRWEWTGETDERVFDGSSDEGWEVKNTGTSNWYYQHSENADKWPQTVDFLASHYLPNQITNSNMLEGVWLVYSSGSITRIRYGTEDTVANFKTWLASNNVTVLYPLATPTIEQGRVSLPDIPDGATITIPELENVGVKCFLPGMRGVMDAMSDVVDMVDEGYATKEELRQATVGLYDYKGSVATYGDLPSTGLEVGDVYNVQSDYQNNLSGTNYAWTGTAWDALGGEVDLSGYAETGDVPTKLTDLTNDGDFVRDASYVHTDSNYTAVEKAKLDGISTYTSNPAANGTASAGTATGYSRGDHVHPTDTTRAPLASPALTGTPTAPTAASGTNTTQLATTAFVQQELDLAMSKFTTMPVFDTWDDLSSAIANDLGPTLMPTGTCFEEPWTVTNGSTVYQNRFDVDDHITANLEGGGTAKAMIAQMHYAIPFAMPFSNYQALLHALTVIPAGTYNITMGNDWGTYVKNGKTYQFTLTQAVPVGGVLAGFRGGPDQAPSNWRVYSYSDQYGTAIETVTVSEGTDGTNLGTLTAAGVNVPASGTPAEPVTIGDISFYGLNSMQRVMYGNNRYLHSPLRTWLNSSDILWYEPMTVFDIAPDYKSHKGFLYGFSEGFVDALLPIEIKTALNYVSDGAGSTTNLLTDTMYDRVFLPSWEEHFLAPGQYYGTATGVEGSPFKLWKTIAGTTNPLAASSWGNTATYHEEFIQYDLAAKTTPRTVWMRSANRSNANRVTVVGTQGNCGSDAATTGYSASPALAIGKSL